MRGSVWWRHIAGVLAVGVCCPVLAADVVDVTAFGAKGDGVADDFPAIQKALDHVRAWVKKDENREGWDAQSKSSPRLWFPKGEYRLSRTLVGEFSVSLKGEKGATLRADGDFPILYVDDAFRSVVRGLTFVGGHSHICFWTRNRDVDAFTIEDCTFAGSSAEAVWTEPWSDAKHPDKKYPNIYRPPFDVTRDATGLPVLVRKKWPGTAPNSTRIVIRDCTFADCGALYRGHSDGQFFSRLTFASSRRQELPVLNVSGEVELTDISMTANLPADYPYGWVTMRESNADLRRVVGHSTSGFGAPLLWHDGHTKKDRSFFVARSVRLQDCTADVAGGTSGALIAIPKREPLLLHVTGCRERQGKTIDLFNFPHPPKTLSEMAFVDSIWPSTGETNLHKWVIADNGPEIAVNVPDIFRDCLEKPLPASVREGMPKLDEPVVDPFTGPFEEFRAADFGITLESDPAKDAPKLERLFAAVAKSSRPRVFLPGRHIRMSRTLPLPRRCRMEGLGRAILAMPGFSNDLFRVTEGAGKIALSFDDVGFRGGRFACVAEGTGDILFRNATLGTGYKPNCHDRGFDLVKCGEGELRLTVDDASVYSPQLVRSQGATVRVQETWVETRPENDIPFFLEIHGGTLLCDHVLGVPICGTNPNHSPMRLPDFKDGVFAAWILNDGAVVRTRNFRFGGEHSGYTPMAIRGRGTRTLLEGQVATWRSPTGFQCVFHNEDPTARIALDNVSLMAFDYPTVLIRGVRPAELLTCGARNKLIVSEIPRLSLRMRADETASNETWKRFFAAVKANPDCCDEFWFSTGVGAPSLDWHRKNVAVMDKAMREVRKLGYAPALQFQATLGHGDAFGKPEMFAAKTWTGWTDWQGREMKYCNCPRQPAFHEYLRKVAAAYAPYAFDAVWIDDDLRLRNHRPADNDGPYVGCWCATCLKAFNEEIGASWTREKLAEAVRTDATLAARWRQFSVEGLSLVAKTIAETFRARSPLPTMMALQHCANTDNVDQVTAVLKTLRETSGRAVGFRPGGGAYYDDAPHGVVEKSLQACWFRKLLGDPDYVKIWTPEIESWPRTYYSRSSRGVTAEGFVALMYGMNSVSFFVANSSREAPAVYGDNLWKPLAAAAPVLKGYAEATANCEPVGFTVSRMPWLDVRRAAIPVLPGIGKSCGELTAEDLARNPNQMTIAEVQAFRDALDKRAGGLPAKACSPFLGLMVPHVDKTGTLRTVALFNTRLTSQGPVRLALRRVPSDCKTLFWHEMGKEPVRLAVERAGGQAFVTVPSVDYWNGGYVGR